MFDPTEFLGAAHLLVSERGTVPVPATRAARVRTAYGRAYYALYLLIRGELERRHRIRSRRLHHGAVYTHLQSPRANEQVRRLGRDLERLYALRQKADYELSPSPAWAASLQDVQLASELVHQATRWAAQLPRLDFAPVAPLF